jgi:hypothetical protein
VSRYLVQFDRLGRVPNPPNLECEADDSDDLEAAILNHSRPYHGSRGREVVLTGDENGGTGTVLCGFHSGGSFTYAAVQS